MALVLGGTTGQGLSQSNGTVPSWTWSGCVWCQHSTAPANWSTAVSLSSNNSNYQIIYSYQNSDTPVDVPMAYDNSGGLGFTGVTITAGTWLFLAWSFIDNGNKSFYVSDTFENTFEFSGTAAGQNAAGTPDHVIGSNAQWDTEVEDIILVNYKCWSGVTLTEQELLRERYFWEPQRQADLHSWLPLIDGPEDWHAGNTWTETGTTYNNDAPPLMWQPKAPVYFIPEQVVGPGFVRRRLPVFAGQI